MKSSTKLLSGRRKTSLRSLIGKTEATRYLGKVCAKHPQLKGERYIANSLCRGCGIERSAEWNKKNPERVARNGKRSQAKHRVRRINAHYLKRYGITLERRNEMLFVEQGGRCACCKADSKNWHIDHDHATGKVRGILCAHCNWLIGHARDSVTVLRAAIDYLSAAA